MRKDDRYGDLCICSQCTGCMRRLEEMGALERGVMHILERTNVLMLGQMCLSGGCACRLIIR